MKQLHLLSLILLLLLKQSIASAQDTLPDLPTQGKTSGDFIPAGWQVLHEASGDFNKDQAADKALLLRSEQHYILLILLQEAQGFKRSFAGSFSSIDYISKLGTRNNTLQLVFDLPSYSAGHLINIYTRYQQEDWYIIGYTEESYDGYDEASGRKKNAGGQLKDVNLVTGEVAVYALKGKLKTLKQKSKQAKEPLLPLKNLDQLSIMNW